MRRKYFAAFFVVTKKIQKVLTSLIDYDIKHIKREYLYIINDWERVYRHLK